MWEALGGQDWRRSGSDAPWLDVMCVTQPVTLSAMPTKDVGPCLLSLLIACTPSLSEPSLAPLLRPVYNNYLFLLSFTSTHTHMDLDPEIQNGKIDTAISRQLVLDYLLHNCYGETARAFMKDDLDTVKDPDVRKGAHVQNGVNGASSNGTSSHTNGTSAKGQVLASVMARNASDDSRQRRGSSTSLMMETEPETETEKDEVDLEGDSSMGERFIVIKPAVSASTLVAKGTDAPHVDERLKNLETRKGIVAQSFHTLCPLHPLAYLHTLLPLTDHNDVDPYPPPQRSAA